MVDQNMIQMVRDLFKKIKNNLDEVLVETPISEFGSPSRAVNFF